MRAEPKDGVLTNDAVYLVEEALKRAGKDHLIVLRDEYLGEALSLGDPLAVLRRFVMECETGTVHKIHTDPEGKGPQLDVVFIPAWVARDLGLRFRAFLEHVDGGGSPSGLARLLGFHSRGRSHPRQMAKTKKANLNRAMDVAWLIHGFSIEGDPVSAKDAIRELSVWAKGMPEFQGYSRTSLIEAWNRYGDTASMAVGILTNAEYGPLMATQDLPSFATAIPLQ